MVRPYDAQSHIDKDASPNHMRTLEEEEEEEKLLIIFGKLDQVDGGDP